MEFLADTECRDRPCLGDSERRESLCLDSGVFTEDCGPVHTSSQASRNKGECLEVLCKALMPRSQGSWWLSGLGNDARPGHSLDVICCAGKFQRNH